MGTPIAIPVRDVALDEQHRLDVQRDVIKGAVAYVPLIGVLAVTINLLIQVRGNQSVALAIVANLPLSSLALVVAVNVTANLLPAMIAGLGTVAQNVAFDVHTRSMCTRAAIVCALIAVFVASPIVLGGALVTVFLWGRIDRSRAATPTPPPVPFYNHVEPGDRVMWDLWREGRERQRLDGMEVPRLEVERVPLRDLPRTLREIDTAVAERAAAIRKARRLTAGNAAYTALFTGVSLYGFSTLTLPAQYAPLERIDVLGTTAPLYGYVFATSPGTGIFVPRSFQAVTPLQELRIVDQRLCARPGFPSTPLITLLPVPRDRETNTVQCPAYPGKVTGGVPQPNPGSSVAPTTPLPSVR